MYFDGYKYWLAYKNEDTSYYRCCRYISSKCPGRCLSENGKVQITAEHNHPAEPNRALIDKFRKALTHRAATEKIELHVIYCDEATSRHADAALLYPFTSAESAMRKARQKQLPQTPKTIDEVIDILDKSDFFRVNSGSDKDPIYQKTITVEDAVLMIFMHRKTFELFSKIDELHLDATFEFVSQTQPTYYMVTGHSVQGNITAPVVYGIFTAKTQSAYTEFFRYIREELKVVPSMIVSDFDQVMQASLAYVFPESIIKGCWFHYTDAVLGYMKSLGLQKETAKGIGSSALRMLLVLPLLPPEYMAPGLEALKKWMKEKNIFSKGFSDLCNYVEQCWLRLVGAQKMSIFGATRIMSNHVKKFNKELSSIISVQNPVIWIILDSITQLATKMFVRVNKRIKSRKAAGPNININCAANSAGRTQKKNELIADTIISNATQLWIKTPVHLRNTLQFLQLNSHFITDSMFLSYLSDIKETNYLPSTQRIPSAVSHVSTVPPASTVPSITTVAPVTGIASVPSIPSVTSVAAVPPPETMPSISSSAVSDFQQGNWVHQSTQVQDQQPSLDFIHQGTHHIAQNNYADVTGQQHHPFVQPQGQMELQHNAFNHCYMQDQFSNLNIGSNHQHQSATMQQMEQQTAMHQMQQPSQVEQQQQYLAQHQHLDVFPQQHSQQHYLEQQQEQFSQHQQMNLYHHQQAPILQNHQHHSQQQHLLQDQQHVQEQQQPTSHLFQNQQHMQPQQQPVQQQHIQSQAHMQQQPHLRQQQQHLQQQQPISQRIPSRPMPSEPPPLRILPHVKRLPCKRRLPLLSELPPLVPISSKRPSKPL